MQEQLFKPSEAELRQQLLNLGQELKETLDLMQKEHLQKMHNAAKIYQEKFNDVWRQLAPHVTEEENEVFNQIKQQNEQD